jgi:hypothetical protein
MALLVSASLSGCFEPEKSGVSYAAYNHTDKSIVSIIVNGEGGILGSRAHGGGGEICCVVIPNKWYPGLKATIKWEEDGDWLLDENGKEVIRNGKRVYVPAPWKEKTVEVLEYDKHLGQLQMHFFPGDEIKIVVSNYMPGHPKYPLSIPDEDK